MLTQVDFKLSNKSYIEKVEDFEQMRDRVLILANNLEIQRKNLEDYQKILESQRKNLEKFHHLLLKKGKRNSKLLEKKRKLEVKVGKLQEDSFYMEMLNGIEEILNITEKVERFKI